MNSEPAILNIGLVFKHKHLGLVKIPRMEVVQIRNRYRCNNCEEPFTTLSYKDVILCGEHSCPCGETNGWPLFVATPVDEINIPDLNQVINDRLRDGAQGEGSNGN